MSLALGIGLLTFGETLAAASGAAPVSVLDRLTLQDRGDSMPAGVVNDTFARMYWPREDPLGKRFRMGPEGAWIIVVGVSRTARVLNIAELPQPYIYLPLERHPTNRLTLLAHTATDPLPLIDPVRELVRSLDAHLPVANTRSLRSLYLVGATRGDVLRLVLLDGARLAAIGVVLGLIMSLPVRRALGAILAGVGPLSPWTLVVVPIGVMAVALVASLVPARAAASVDPTQVLRLE